MNIDLSGKVALVTASTAGIGYAIAKGLAASGAEVIINGRSEHSVNAAMARLQQEVPGFRPYPAVADLSDAAGVSQLLQAVNEVDILVNNAGIYGPQDFYATDDATWENYWQTNVMSGVRLSRAPATVARFWLRRSGSCRREYCVLPGPTLSDGFAEMMKDEVTRTGKPLEQLAKEFVMAQRPASVIQRAASVDEVANMVVYVCSPQASATSGAALRVDGGVVDDIV